MIQQAVASGLLMGMIYALVAAGLSLIFGLMDVVNFAHGEMMTVAMFIAVVLFSWFHLDPMIMLVPMLLVLFAMIIWPQIPLWLPELIRPDFLK